MDKLVQQFGGYDNLVMGMMIHEMYHLQEGDDQANGLAKKRKMGADQMALRDQLQSDARLRSLIVTYIRIIFSIGDCLKNSTPTAQEVILLSDLKVVIAEMKDKYQNLWNFVWNYEYLEGFAEYASAFSMVHSQIISQEKKFDLEKIDQGNNFTYRTGTFAGFYLFNRLHKMPFQNQEDHFASVWEVILKETRTTPSSLTIDQIIEKYGPIPIDIDAEIKKVIDY
jgi:hypothetical protein